jgi:hypothetical protein
VKAPSEAGFMAVVAARARLCGFKVVHVRTSTTRRGKWATPVQFDGTGFVDLLMVRANPPKIVYAELKAGRGRPTATQVAWLDWLEAAGAEVYLWRDTPSGWAEIERVLTEGRG